jgi:hypothetical protein
MIGVYAIPLLGVLHVSLLLGVASAGAAALCVITKRGNS